MTTESGSAPRQMPAQDERLEAVAKAWAEFYDHDWDTAEPEFRASARARAGLHLALHDAARRFDAPPDTELEPRGCPTPGACSCPDAQHPHLIDGEFQSDKYPTTPRGKVPLSCKDKTAQDLLWIYAQRRRAVDAEFSADLEMALRTAGFEPSPAADPPWLDEAIDEALLGEGYGHQIMIHSNRRENRIFASRLLAFAARQPREITEAMVRAVAYEFCAANPTTKECGRSCAALNPCGFFDRFLAKACAALEAADAARLK